MLRNKPVIKAVGCSVDNADDRIAVTIVKRGGVAVIQRCYACDIFITRKIERGDKAAFLDLVDNASHLNTIRTTCFVVLIGNNDEKIGANENDGHDGNNGRK